MTAAPTSTSGQPSGVSLCHTSLATASEQMHNLLALCLCPMYSTCCFLDGGVLLLSLWLLTCLEALAAHSPPSVSAPQTLRGGSAPSSARVGASARRTIV